MSGLVAMVRRQLRANRTVTIVMAVIVTINDIVQVRAYQSLFPNAGLRESVLSGFTSNGALRALYGYPYDISTPTGWLAWRSLGFLAIVMAGWAAFVTAGGLRGEEEAGRGELTLSQPQRRQVWLAAAMIAVTVEALVVGVVNAGGLSLFCVTQGSMTLSGTAEASLQLVLAALLFAAVAVLTSQLFGTTRGARVAAAAVLALAFFARTGADTGNGIGWLRWVTPLGWVEELHPPATPSVPALLLIGAAILLLLLASFPMLGARDIGLALLPQHDSRRPRRLLLGSPWQAALRDDLLQLSIWAAGAVAGMLLMGSLTGTVLDLVRRNPAFGTLFGTSFALNAFIAAAFALVQLLASLLAVTMIMGARGEEATGRLELLLAEPLSRTAWLLGRAALAAGVALALTAASAVALWGGAAAAGQAVGLGSLVEAALNCIPLVLVTVGAAVAILALAPRALGFTYALVAVAFLWDALGTAFKAPPWVLDVSPFHALAAVPQDPFALLPAVVVTVIGLALTALGTSVFRGRDLAAG